MKRKFLALVCLTALAFALFTPSASGAKYDGIYCVAVNDTVMLDLLTAENMPFPNGGQMYVPYTVFDGSMGESLDTHCNVRVTDTLTIYTKERALVFNIGASNCTDNAGTQYTSRAISRNGRLFVPISFVCTFFDLTYSYLITELSDGVVPILRISNRFRTKSNNQFAAEASYTVTGPVTNYLRSVPGGQSAPPTQSSPAVTPPTPPPTASGGQIDRSDIQVYLAFEVTGETAGLAEILNALAAQRVSALFLFRPDELAARDAEVRRVLGRGHRVGLLLGDDAATGYAEGARLLAHIARAETRIVALPTGAEGAEGWAVWADNVDGRAPAGTATARASALLTAAAARRTPVRVTLGCDAQAPSTTNYLLRGLLDARYDLRPVTEGSLLPAGG